MSDEFRTNKLILDAGGCLCCPQGTSFPETPIEGNFFYRTDEKKFYQYDGEEWMLITILVAALTAGSIPFADADGKLAQDNANFFWDNVLKRLKIGGAAAPGADVHLYNAAAFVDMILEGNGGAVIRHKDLGAPADKKWIEFRTVGGIGKFQSITDAGGLNKEIIIMDLGTGDVGIGLVPTANMVGLSIEKGVVTIKETTTPTADADYGKVYTKNDNKLYFQDGAGNEHEIAFVV